MQMDYKNELCMKLCEFIYETADAIYLAQFWEALNETMGVRLEKMHNMNIVTDDDLTLLREAYASFVNNDNSHCKEYILKLDQLIERICENDLDYVLDVDFDEKTDSAFNFLD